MFLSQSQDAEGFLEVFSQAFGDISRKVVGQVPRILTVLVVFLVFFVLAIAIRRILNSESGTRSRSQRLQEPGLISERSHGLRRV